LLPFLPFLKKKIKKLKRYFLLKLVLPLGLFLHFLNPEMRKLTHPEGPHELNPVASRELHAVGYSLISGP
jgi:hypothetical protein